MGASQSTAAAHARPGDFQVFRPTGAVEVDLGRVNAPLDTHNAQLQDLCVVAVARNIVAIGADIEMLPDELIERVHMYLDGAGQLDIETLSKTVGERSTSLRVSQFRNLSSSIVLELMQRAVNVTCLDVSGSADISDADLAASLAHMPHIERLLIAGCGFAAADTMRAINALSSLVALDVSRTNITGKMLAASPLLPQLRELIIRSLKSLDDAQLRDIAALLQCVERLDFSHTENNLSCLNPVFSHMPNLTALHADSNRVDCDSVAALPTTLRELHLVRTDVGAFGATYAHMPRLEVLATSFRFASGEPTLVESFGLPPSLTELDMVVPSVPSDLALLPALKCVSLHIQWPQPSRAEIELPRCESLTLIGESAAARDLALCPLVRQLTVNPCLEPDAMRRLRAAPCSRALETLTMQFAHSYLPSEAAQVLAELAAPGAFPCLRRVVLGGMHRVLRVADGVAALRLARPDVLVSLADVTVA